MTDASSVALMFRLHPRSAWTPTKHPALRLMEWTPPSFSGIVMCQAGDWVTG